MSLRLPFFWKRMGFTAKAAYLCSSHQAKDYSEACAKLRALKPRKPSRVPVNQGNPEKFWWND